MRARHRANPTGILRSHACRCAAAAAAAGTLALGTTAPALADIGKGFAHDPAGDTAGAPAQDFVAATAQYDSNGSVSVSATMKGNIAKGPASLFSFGVASFAAPESCSGVTLTLSGFSTSKTGTVTL